MTDARRSNRDTVQAYEAYAAHYAAAVATEPSEPMRGFLHALAAGTGQDGLVLEIGSGPGFDADFLERLGCRVRRTDVTHSFLALQAERGRVAERLDVVDDALGGPYDAIVALYVLQHIDRSLIPAILSKVRDALRPGGALLLTVREGVGDTIDERARADRYFVALWSRKTFEEALAKAGLSMTRIDHTTDEEGDWMIVLARRDA